jgi:hypothetical protein
MADSDKNILITPNRGQVAQPSVVFTGQGNDPIVARVLDGVPGALSFEGSAGQLFSITNNLTTGSIFSVNDVSGIPSIDVNADGTVSIAAFGGNVGIGLTTAPLEKLHVNGNIRSTNFSPSSQALDFDTAKAPGLYHYDGAFTGTRPPDNVANYRTVELGGLNRLSQIALPWNSDNLYFRRSVGTTWFPWSKVWTNLNDGAGSGLDADLLDGENLVDNAATASTVVGRDASGDIIARYYTSSVTNSNQGYAGQHLVNAPFYNTFSQTGSQYQAIVKGRCTGSTTTEIISFGNLHYVDGTQQIAFHKIRSDGTNSQAFNLSGPGGLIWNAGNDGAGSGLDADLLDGENLVDGAATANTVVGRNASGDVVVNRIIATSTGRTGSIGGSTGAGAAAGTIANQSSYLEILSGNGGVTNSGGLVFHNPGVSTSVLEHVNTDVNTGYFNFRSDDTNWNVRINGNLAWHAGNDGSGSGLDADLLDGIDSGSIVLSRSTVLSANSTDFNTITTPGTYTVGGNGTWTGSTNGPTSAYAYGQLVVTTNGSVVTQNYFTHSLTGHWVRSKYNASDWQSWQEYWTNLNDGAGSGLDADLLDGIDSAGFVQTSGNQTVAGVKTFSSNIAANGGISINNASPTIGLIDTDHATASIHVNSNIFYILRNAAGQAGWTTVDGVWPMALNLLNNNAEFGRTISSQAYQNITHFQANWRNDGVTALASSYNYILTAPNDTGNKLSMFVNSSTRTADGGANALTLRNDGGPLNLGSGSFQTSIIGSQINLSGGSTQYLRNNPAISNNSYAVPNNHIELRTDNASNPILGFHRAGSTATALYHAGYGIDSLRIRNADGNDGPIFSTFNDGAGSGLDADLLDGENLVDNADTASTVVGRDGSGDIRCRLVRQTFGDNNFINGGIVFRTNNTNDNFLRVCNNTAAIRTFLDTPSLSGDNIFTGGNKISIQNATDGGNSRGIFLWNDTDFNWGIYMSTAGAGKSLSGGTASNSLSGRAGHHFRNRIFGGAGNSFVWENGAETQLMEIQGDTGNVHVRGSIIVALNNPSSNAGIVLADDGDIIDPNTGYCAMRFAQGVQVYSGNKSGSPVITLGSNGVVSASRVACGYDSGIANSISCSEFFRSSGNSGWYNATHDGGWYMDTSAYVRSYADKSVYTGGSFRAGTIDDNPAANNNLGARVGGQLISVNRDNEVFPPLFVGRRGNGDLVRWYRGGVLEGTITNTNGTIAYNPFLGSHWGRLEDGSKPDIFPGTILETVNKLIEWKLAIFEVNGEEKKYAYNGPLDAGNIIEIEYEGNTYQAIIVQEKEETSTNSNKHVCVKVNDTLASKAVFGVFLSWDEGREEKFINSWNDMNCAAVGNYFIRIAAGQVLEIGDLIESDGTGCGVVQPDDIIRSKTVGKVTSTIPQVTYDDGSFLVTAVLYCG